MLTRRPSDALLLVATIAVIALVLIAVLALQHLTAAPAGSLGAPTLLQLRA